MAEDVSRVETLAGDVQFQLLGQGRRDVVENLAGGVVAAKDLLIPFDGPRRHFGAWVQIQGVLDVGAEHVGFGGLRAVQLWKSARKTNPAIE